MRTTKLIKTFYYSEEYLKIYDGATNTSPVVGQYCEGKSKPQNFISSTNEILLYFKSKNNYGDRKGFQLEYKTSSEYLELFIKMVIIEKNSRKSLGSIYSNFDTTISFKKFKSFYVL